MNQKSQSLLTSRKRKQERKDNLKKIQGAYRQVKAELGQDLSLTDEFYFKGSCAALLDSTGFIPKGFVQDTVRIACEKRTVYPSIQKMSRAMGARR